VSVISDRELYACARLLFRIRDLRRRLQIVFGYLERRCLLVVDPGLDEENPTAVGPKRSAVLDHLTDDSAWPVEE
jgi:hypothetical protein